MSRTRIAFAASAICLVVWPSVGNGQNLPAANANTPQPAPPAKRTTSPPNPAFPPGRGGNGPLQIPIRGLADGTSRVAAGLRLFSLCWQGGSAPYEIGLSGSGHAVIDLAGIDGLEITRDGAVDLEPGTYAVSIGDGSGARTSGGFAVVPRSEIPGGQENPPTQGDALREANELLAQGGAFDFEAYLRLKALQAPGAESQRLLDGICRRPVEETREATVASVYDTQLVISDEYSLSNLTPGTSAAGPASPSQVFSYLTQARAIVSEALYSYETTSADTTGGRQDYNSHSNYQQATALLDYGVTDDWAMGAELPVTSSETKFAFADGTSLSSNRTAWGDPTLFSTYRILRQSDAPATLFVQSSFSPDTFFAGQNIFDIGQTLIRREDRFAFAEVADATSYGALDYSVAQPDGSMLRVSYNPVWRYHIALAATAALSERWSASLGANFALPYRRMETVTNSFNPVPSIYSIQTRDVFSLAPSIGYEFIPGKLSLWLTYGHYFDTSYTVTPAGTTKCCATLTKTNGADVVGLVLRSTVSLDAIENTVF